MRANQNQQQDETEEQVPAKEISNVASGLGGQIDGIHAADGELPENPAPLGKEGWNRNAKVEAVHSLHNLLEHLPFHVPLDGAHVGC